ncbi:MAG: glucosylceramidase [Bacteroidetes bacterium]|nr:glucosylceramidase [Bacteroidota bacterium]
MWFLSVQAGCDKSKNSGSTPPITPPVKGTNDIDCWMTKSDQSQLLQKQTAILSFGTVSNSSPFIDVSETTTFQAIDGFGYTLTGGSAFVINNMSPANKSTLLNELFGSADNSIGISYLRLSIGASDLNAAVFSYDDIPAGQTDTNLAHFSLAQDTTDLIPLLKQILLINPKIKIIAAPWSAPVWMKDNGNSAGGSLLPAYYNAYAQYFVKYIQAMKAEGIVIDAITPQNEPLNPNNNPSLVMTGLQQADFIKNNLGPAFQSASIATKIVAYDHNCDHPDYPMTVLNDASAKAFTDGSAFHLYAGDIGALTTVHNAYPDKNLYFTEQYTASSGDFGGDLKWHLKNVIIGSMRNWSKTALEWNLANDPSYGPHTPGGCTTCKGALTINANVVTRNVAYYIIAHASKFVDAGSIRIASNNSGNLNTVAFKTAAGKKVLIVENDGSDVTAFNIRFNGKWATATIPGGAVATYVW